MCVPAISESSPAHPLYAPAQPTCSELSHDQQLTADRGDGAYSSIKSCFQWQPTGHPRTVPMTVLEVRGTSSSRDSDPSYGTLDSDGHLACTSFSVAISRQQSLVTPSIERPGSCILLCCYLLLDSTTYRSAPSYLYLLIPQSLVVHPLRRLLNYE